MAMDKLTVVVSGMIAGTAWQGGATWAVLQYVLGLKQLGHDVYFVEPVKESALSPTGVPLRESTNADYFRRVIAEFGLEHTSALLAARTRQTVGLPYERLREIARQAHVLINISGMLRDDALVECIPVRVYLDLDPVFNHFWHLQGIDVGFAGHTHYVTVGQALGQPGCPVPTFGWDWITTPQPIVLEHWPVAPGNHEAPITTIANWRSYGSLEHDGVFYGQKAHSLRQYMPLPRLSDEKFVLALAIHPDEHRDLAALAHNGWELRDPADVTATPTTYKRFIQDSKAEIGIAKSGYVAARCGWFSDRSICYLALGRPVIAQDTGFSHYLPTGEGLFAFESMDDLLASIAALRHDYKRHARVARDIAEEYFDSDRVLRKMLARIGIGS